MRSAFKKVLAAVDRTKPSEAALLTAKLIAKKTGATLDLVHVEELPLNVWSLGALPVTTARWWPGADFHEWRESRLRAAVADLPEKRVRIRTVPGWPPLKLADLARSSEADLVVMGTHGYAGLDRALFGSVSEAVVRRALVPVLAVHEKAPRAIRRVLAPWNARPYATAALRRGAALARALGASLEILHVAPPWQKESEVRPRLQRRLAAALKGERGLRWSLSLRGGDPRAVILREADPRRFDLLVLSAHRRPLGSDFVLGSTVERVLRHSRVAVLAVPSVGTGRPMTAALPPDSWLANETYLF